MPAYQLYPMMSTEFLDRLASQLKIGRDPISSVRLRADFGCYIRRVKKTV